MFGFKKRPENDIWQYFVDAVISGTESDIYNSNVIFFIIKTNKNFLESTPTHNGKRFKNPSFGGGKPTIYKDLTVKQACKFCKKHKLVLEVDPDESFEIFEYVTKHLPRERWMYNSFSKYARFN